MKANISLGRILGIKIGLHYSWFFVALLVAFSLAAQFRATNPEWGALVIWAAAITTGVLFFSALLAHELSHSIVARSRGIAVRGITLFALGGVSETEQESVDPKTEFLVAIVGPITSAVAGVLFLILAWVGGWQFFSAPSSPIMAILVWLGYVNIVLAIFNLIPGFPLDGGRVLRAIVWRATGNLVRSTRIAAGIGQAVAIGFILLGLVRFFGGAGLGGLWLVFIGWFLLDAARASSAQVQMAEILRDVHVSDAMSRDCLIIDGRLNLQTFIEDVLMRTGRRCFVVGDKEHITGLVTPHEIKRIERTRWPYTTVDNVMRPIDQLRTIAPDAPITTALEVMGREDVNQLPVTSNGHLEGIVSRGNILRLLQNRTELQA
jgi:Zn-dependent protease/CBS domain-containing protein